MSNGVHIQVTIPTSEPSRLKLLAAASFSEPWAGTLIDDCNSLEWVPGVIEAYEFLDDLREGRSFWKRGNEGDVFLWGMVGNHSDPTAFVERLMLFWDQLFESDEPVVTHEWQRILVIYTRESADPGSGIIQIGWDDPESVERKLAIFHTPMAGFTCI